MFEPEQNRGRLSPDHGRICGKSAKKRWHSRCVGGPFVPSNISVVIATTVRMPVIQSVSLFSGRVIRFTDNKLAAALESIQLNHPRLIAIEALLAQTPAGKGFIERVERLGLRGSAIHLIVQSNGKWTTTPYNVEPAAGAADAGGAHADRKAAIITTPAAAAWRSKGRTPGARTDSRCSSRSTRWSKTSRRTWSTSPSSARRWSRSRRCGRTTTSKSRCRTATRRCG